MSHVLWCCTIRKCRIHTQFTLPSVVRAVWQVANCLKPRSSPTSVCHLQYQHVVKFVKCRDIPGCWVDTGRMYVWRSITFPENRTSKWAHHQSQLQTMEQLSGQHQAILVMFKKPSYSSTEVWSHFSTRPPNIQVRHCTLRDLPGFHPTNTGVKMAWVWGYRNDIQ